MNSQCRKEWNHTINCCHIAPRPEGKRQQSCGRQDLSEAKILSRAISNTALRLQTKRRQKPEIQGFASKNHLLKNEALKGVDFIAIRKELSIKVDYLSIVFDSIGTRELIQRILGLSADAPLRTMDLFVSGLNASN